MQSPTQIPQRILEIHKTAIDSTRFLKGQQWVVTNFGTALNGILFVLAVDSETVAMLLLAALATAVALAGISMVVSFQEAIHENRRRCNWIYQQYYTDQERDELNLIEPNRSPWTLMAFTSWGQEPFILMVAVLVAGWTVGVGFVIGRLF